jgi:signal transduction histidine kinase
MTSSSRAAAGEQGAKLLLAAGALTLVNNYLPGSGHLDLAVLNTVAVVTLLLGAASLFVPWGRLPLRAPLVLVPVAFALIAASNHFGGVSSFSYAVYFVVVFVWVGIAQPPGTALALSPLAALAYLLPFLVADDPPANAVSSVTVAVPVCVLVGETLARSVRRLDQSRRDLRRRVELVERLAHFTGRLGRDLDAEAVQRTLLDGSRELLGGTAATLFAVEDDRAVVQAVSGVQADLQGSVVLEAGEPFRAALAGGAPSVVRIDEAFPAWAPPADLVGARIAVVACGSPPIGVLTLAVPADRELGDAELDVLRLLANQGAAAIVNARTHAAVVAQRAHEQAVVDVLADGVLVLDEGGRVVSCNRVAEQLLGTGREQLVGVPLPVQVGPPGTPLQQQVAGRWVETAASVLPATGEHVVAVRDVSRARALDEAKDLFLAATSHELRTPLTAVKGYVNMLQRRWDVLDESTRLQALATVAERTDALVALTNHLLLGARAGASRHSATSEPFDLTSAVASTAATFEHTSERHRVVVELPSHQVVALGDPSSVQHIVGQLVENAVKYSPLGGTVTVAVSTRDGRAVVEVADEGIGIPAGQEAALFTPFFQAGATNTRQYGGVGLGLYIVRQLVEAQGGSVTARNRDGGGACLCFTLPLLPGPLRTAEDSEQVGAG